MATHGCETVLRSEDVLAQLPAPLSYTGLFDTVATQSASLPILVVLYDDPTGMQTCHNINVLTVWDHNTLLEEFSSQPRGFFILTNSAVKEAARESDKEFEVVLRGHSVEICGWRMWRCRSSTHSTLRGNLPDEPEVAEQICGKVDAWILAPFFRQGGRLTINDVHYVASLDGDLVPAAQTPFAKDATFGYKSSNLREYVFEKSKGQITADQVHSMSLRDIRVGGIARVIEILLALPAGSIVIANAIGLAFIHKASI